MSKRNKVVPDSMLSKEFLSQFNIEVKESATKVAGCGLRFYITSSLNPASTSAKTFRTSSNKGCRRVFTVANIT